MQKRMVFIIIAIIALTVASLGWYQYFKNRKSPALTPDHSSITLTIMAEDESHKGRVGMTSNSGTHAMCVYGFDASIAGGKNYSYQIGVTRNPESGSYQITELEGFSGLKKNDIITLNDAAQWRHEEAGVTVEMTLSESQSVD